jgi:glycosyltransferase involved in cell wall biosynthesis
MSEQPKVSVTIPSYNHARFLPAAIESVLAQTYPALELIIVDDGSTDGSLQIAEAYAARHPDLIQVRTHEGHANRGPSATVNLCFQLATGVYWMGLPSDDLLHPRKVAEQVAFLEQHPEAGWVYCYAQSIDEDGARRPDLGLFGTDITRAPDQVEQLILGNAVPGMTVLMRRAAVAQIEPHDEALVYSDWDFWVRLAAHHRAAFMPRARVRYRVHSYNTSVGTKTETNLRRSLEVLLKLRRRATEIGGALARPRTQALLDLQLAFYAYCVRDEPQARQQLAAAFATDPTLTQAAPYFMRWLKHCYYVMAQTPELPPDLDFGPWVLSNLPAGLDEKFMQTVTKRMTERAFNQTAGNYHNAAAHWQGRRKLLGSLLHDPRVWRERELFALHVEAFAGSRIRKQLRRLLAQREHATAGR